MGRIRLRRSAGRYPAPTTAFSYVRGTMGRGSGIESSQVGVTGEYFVAAELSLRGILASITLRNSRGIDIIASSRTGSRSVSIQVKTSSGNGAKWILTKKSEDFAADNHFYIFVLLQGVGFRPDFYVVPSAKVAETVRTGHASWLAGSKSDGSERKDSSIRNFSDPVGQYREAWDLLGLRDL